MNHTYKPTNQLNLPGVLMLILSILVSGTVFSAVYLLLNKHIPFIYISILFAVLLGAGVGFAGAWVVKRFKLTNVIAVVIISLICGIAFQYVKWAMYVNWDYKATSFEATGLTAYEYYELEYDFDDSYIYTDIETYISDMQTQTVAEYIGEEYMSYIQDTYEYTTDEIEQMHEMPYYSYFGYDEILGDDIKTAVENLEKSKQMEASRYAGERVGQLTPSIIYLLSHPVELINEILSISEEGRWSVSSGSTSRAATFNGPLLIIVWLAEFAIIFAMMLSMIVTQVRKPFIEREDEWAILYTNNLLMLDAGNKISKEEQKNIDMNPKYLLDLQAINVIPELSYYYTIEVYHSKDLRDNYINIFLCKNGKKNKNSRKQISTYRCVDKAFIDALYEHCHITTGEIL